MLKSLNNKITKTYVGYTNNLNLRLENIILAKEQNLLVVISGKLSIKKDFMIKD